MIPSVANIHVANFPDERNDDDDDEHMMIMIVLVDDFLGPEDQRIKW